MVSLKILAVAALVSAVFAREVVDHDDALDSACAPAVTVTVTATECATKSNYLAPPPVQTLSVAPAPPASVDPTPPAQTGAPLESTVVPPVVPAPSSDAVAPPAPSSGAPPAPAPSSAVAPHAPSSGAPGAPSNTTQHVSATADPLHPSSTPAVATTNGAAAATPFAQLGSLFAAGAAFKVAMAVV